MGEVIATGNIYWITLVTSRILDTTLGLIFGVSVNQILLMNCLITQSNFIQTTNPLTARPVPESPNSALRLFQAKAFSLF